MYYKLFNQNWFFDYSQILYSSFDRFKNFDKWLYFIYILKY